MDMASSSLWGLKYQHKFSLNNLELFSTCFVYLIYIYIFLGESRETHGEVCPPNWGLDSPKTKPLPEASKECFEKLLIYTLKFVHKTLSNHTLKTLAAADCKN